MNSVSRRKFLKITGMTAAVAAAGGALNVVAQQVIPNNTDVKGTKGLGEALFGAVGFLSFLFGALMLLMMMFAAIGSIFTSTKPLFQFRRVKKDEDNSHGEPRGGGK